jgi:DMSO/TMAO reductase YedYZ heme-binding membrane subunit
MTGISIPLRRHLLVAAVSSAAAGAVFLAARLSTETWGSPDQIKSDGLLWRFKVATGLVALALLVVTLSIGPLLTLSGRDRRQRVHHPWRRATGVWSAVFALAHVPGGLAIHTSGWRIWEPFASAFPGLDTRPFDEFTIGFWVGATALLAMIVLAATSNRRPLSRMGAHRWKRLHRLTYAVYAFVAVHVVALQFGESRALVWVLLTAGVFAPVIPLRLIRRRLGQHRPPPAGATRSQHTAHETTVRS